ncbi:MAG: pyrroline-5-carboxylate reductase [Simkaniaceae bacterium]|nr:pyrroline-5-carboxylate reductase [Candidatus Sacchlamyda saccharinae]
MRIAIIGVGVMGTAFAKAFIEKGFDVVLCDRSSKSIKGADTVKEPKAAVKDTDIVLIAIKPKDLKGLAAELGDLKGKLVLSILAGVTVASLKSYFPGAEIVRSMPNLALTCNEAVIALTGAEEAKDRVEELLKGLGLVFWTEERLIDGITALAGSGPAFIMAILEAMVESGILMGLKADSALKLALQTMRGTIALIEEHSGHPGELRWQVSAPAGTTIAGMKAFEENSVRSGLIETFLAAYNRSKDLS